MSVMTDREALKAIQQIVDRATMPDGGATVPDLLADLTAVLANLGRDRGEALATAPRSIYPASWRGH